ncbi:MAG: SEC-C metal-binding domain-containing protein [Elusimicrobiota bacterium]
MWNQINKIKDKLFRKPDPLKLPKPVEQHAKKPEVGDFKELEKQGLLGTFFRKWKDPAFLKQIRGLAARMQADGVNVKDQAAVKAWLEKNKKAIESGEIKLEAPAAQAAAPATFTKTGPEVGRNDPCPCGSGKKHKKCCGK